MVIENGTGISKEEIENRISRARESMRIRGIEILIVIGRSFYDRMGCLTYLTNHFPPFPPGGPSPRAPSGRCLFPVGRRCRSHCAHLAVADPAGTSMAISPPANTSAASMPIPRR